MEVELRHLRSFLVVADELHFGRAAERLHLAQPPLSQQIRRLEEELGAELFDRTSRPIRLTPAGASFREEARLALYHAEQALESARRAALGQLGHLSIGATVWAQHAIVPSVLRTFRAQAPGVHIKLASPGPTDQVDALRKERLDVGFVAFARWLVGTRALEVEPLLEEPMVAIVPADHPLARRPEISIDELAKEPFATLSHAVAPGLIDRQLGMFHELGVPPAEIHETLDPAAMLSLIAGGEAVGMHMASFSNSRRRDVAFVPIQGDPPTATLLLLWRCDDDRELVRIFVDAARRAARSLTPPEVLRERNVEKPSTSK